MFNHQSNGYLYLEKEKSVYIILFLVVGMIFCTSQLRYLKASLCAALKAVESILII